MEGPRLGDDWALMRAGAGLSFMAPHANGNEGCVSGENAGIAAPGNFVADRNQPAADRSRRSGSCGIARSRDPGSTGTRDLVQYRDPGPEAVPGPGT